MSEVREFRIFRPPNATPRVQYGFWAPSLHGIQPRFSVLREWEVSTVDQARALMQKLQVDILLDPKMAVPADAKPLPSRQSQRRDLRQLPPETRNLLERAVKGLTDPLPSIEKSHEQLGTVVPESFRDGRHFGSYLNDMSYRRLVAMAAAAGVSRNRMIEALLIGIELA